MKTFKKFGVLLLLIFIVGQLIIGCKDDDVTKPGGTPD